jgi:small-conductance mechanosensitive channel
LIDHQIRSSVKVGVAYGSPLRRVAELISQAVSEQPEVRPDPEPRVTLEDFGDNAIAFETYFWSDVAGERELREIRSSIRFRIDELFIENGIVIAFPQRDVHIDSNRPLEIRMVDGKTDNAGDRQ